MAFLSPDPALELQLAHPPLHSDRHLDAGNGVLLAPPARRIAEKTHDRVPDILVDRGAVTDGDLGHFGQILIEQVCQLLGFETVGSLGEIGDVREEDRQLLPLGGDSDALPAGENRIVQLGRQEFRQFGRQSARSWFFSASSICVRLSSINPLEMAIMANRTTSQLRF
jgi:hypothetical protein